MKKLLVLCPSRNRVSRLLGMIESFKKTTNPEHTDLLILLDKDDSSLNEYISKLSPDIKFQVFDRTGDKTLTTEIINRAFEQNKDYEFYSVTNDDMEYITPKWDETLSVKGKLSCGWELNAGKIYGSYQKRGKYIVHKACFPYTSVIDRNLVMDIGWLQLPIIQHSCGDSIWYFISRHLNKFNPIEKIKYIHHSHYHNDGEYDDTAERTNFYNRIETDYKTAFRWKRHEMMKLVKRIKKEEELWQECQEQKIIPSTVQLAPVVNQ